MSNQIIYKKDADAALWSEAKQLAKDSGQSLSELVTEALRTYLSGPHRPEPVRRVRSTYVPEPERQPAPNPFAAKV